MTTRPHRNDNVLINPGPVAHPAKNTHRAGASNHHLNGSGENLMVGNEFSETRHPSNADLARLLAHVAEALAGAAQLPAVGWVSVSHRGPVTLGTNYGRDGVRDVAEWARMFDTPVVIDLSSSGDLFTVVRLGGVDAQVSRYISHQQAYELGAALGVPVSPGGQVEVSAADLLAALNNPTPGPDNTAARAAGNAGSVA